MICTRHEEIITAVEISHQPVREALELCRSIRFQAKLLSVGPISVVYVVLGCFAIRKAVAK